ncbi:MAG: hypothetical protein HQK70_09820 [Desulfamplus sp.]|nr:hypothetical protein [Desulfamplus sp.]
MEWLLTIYSTPMLLMMRAVMEIAEMAKDKKREKEALDWAAMSLKDIDDEMKGTQA